MKTIKYDEAYVSEAIVELYILPDDDTEYLVENLDIHNESEVRKVIEKYIISDFFRSDEAKQQKIKNALFYYLATRNLRVLQNAVDEAPIYLPPGYEFFSLVWDELFHEPVPTALDPDTEYIEEDSTIYISGDEN